ncbi:putative receptor protein kinase ZmPK1 [Camellia lanceoleosa]|uniref:Receptor protein kinase ZmPK1 n=1 Tax=Camellia lanceoleosa TaxID=1840588 RepID=A0ACC0HJQ1_9ERIC|nr:putative receptor protein kinase ZmPK1 [Camellia lanceoleosa]
MATPTLILFIIHMILSFPFLSFSTPPYSLTEGSSLSVEKPDDVLISPTGVFSAGFHSVGDNAYCFAIWYSEPLYDGSHTVVWMANREQPINGKLSQLSLQKNGNLVLTDADQLNVWATGTKSISSTQLLLYDNGNLVLLTSESLILWQSFDSPTDTLLPNQPLTRNTKLVSSRSQKNYSSGFYKLLFDYDNILRLVFDGPEVTSVYWPDPWKNSWEALRSSFTTNKTATFNSSGHFKSNDDFQFRAADFGTGIQRRLTMDHDGNIRLYSLEERSKTWTVSWQALLEPCRIHGICGPNSLCTYVPREKPGRRCSCLPGYKIKNDSDWSLGCEPDFSPPCNDGDQYGFLQLPHVEFYGYDIKFHSNYSLKNCKNTCLKQCNCYGFQYKFDKVHGFYNCFTKSLLFNGYLSSHFLDSMHIKLPKASLSPYTMPIQEFELNCSRLVSLQLDRTYKKPKENGTLQFMV